MLKVKICGVTRVEDALCAAREGADFVGLIFAKSPRRVKLADARRIVRALPAGTQAVGVFMDQPLGEVRRTLRRAGLRLAQLHGSEDPGYARALGVPVIKTFTTFDAATLERLRDYEVLACLLDLPKGPGGRRARLDPAWARRAKRRGKVMLAGRLTPGTVGRVVRQVRPWGVDVAGGTERAPGVKDPELVRAFIRAARRAGRAKARTR
jgi:phosphoribosylanthranilate isomerase